MGPGPGLACHVRLNSCLPPELRARFQNEDVIRKLLAEARTIAIVGASTDPQKASSFVMSYLTYEGYRVIPVNPRAETVLGARCYPTLMDIPEPVDLVDVFRPSAEVPEYARQAVAIHAKALWTQLRVVHLEAATVAEEAGLAVVMDKCIKMEHGRYGGSLHWYGMNTEIVSARKARLRRA